MTVPTLYRRDPDMVAAEMDGDLVMLSIARGEYFGISGVGTRLWNLLERPISAGEMVAALCAEFEVEESRCRADVDSFLRNLMHHQIVAKA